MLKVENLSTGYGKKQVLFNVSLEVNKGDIVLLAGSNGSGKSTLLKAIYGMLPQWDNGKIWFDGENITGKPTAALLKKGLLYIPQKNNLFEELTVRENLEMAGLTLDKKLLHYRICDVLSIFKTLEQNLKRTPMSLSGGERQLLTLGMATLHQPKMILVDEPFTGLSPQNIDFIAENLKVLNRQNEITLVIVEHRVKECLEFSNRMVGMKLGNVFMRINIIPNIIDYEHDFHLLFV
ncbi:MAG: ATP-binding cassette domain-containing protein [Chlorobium sp.]|jgi:branched-chain amino acid transport system ATP-binding protein|nr:ATP-binding cassette domain-containing protein [Chlorobium sp.]